MGKVGIATLCIDLALAASASAAPTWLAPADIAGPTHSITFPELAVNAGGDAVAIWPRDTGSGTVVEVVERPAGGVWGAPVLLSESGEDEVSSVDVGLDADGDAVAIWPAFDGGYVIRTAARPADGEWSGAEDLFTDGGQTPQLAMNAAGDAVAVWSGFNGERRVTFAAHRRAPGGWAAPEDLSVAGERDGVGPQVAIDAAGNATVAWERNDVSPNAIEAAVRTSDGEWSAADVLSPPSQNAGGPRLAANEAGAAVVAWTAGGGIWAAVRPASGDWSAPKEVSPAGGIPALAIDRSGSSFALWQGDGDAEQVLWTATRPRSGNWSTPAKLSEEALMFQSYELRASAAAGVIAAWTRSVDATTHEVEAAVRRSGGAWSQPALISTPGENAGIPRLGFDAAGNAIAIWGREATLGEYFLQGSGYDFSGPRLDGLRIPATAAAGEPVEFAVSPFDVFPLGATSWDFGDGSPPASGNSVSHAYDRPGTFAVTVSAADASGNVSARTAAISVKDTAAPAPPRLLGTYPSSPARSPSPKIRGEAERGSTVRLYAGAGCAGAPLVIESAAALASPGIPVAVAVGETASFSATATDASGNTSGCSEPISYTRLRPTDMPPGPRRRLCTVPRLAGKTLAAAKRTLRAAGCRVGKARPPQQQRRGHRRKHRGPLVVKGSRPHAGRTVAAGSKVEIVLGWKPRKPRR